MREISDSEKSVFHFVFLFVCLFLAALSGKKDLNSPTGD